MFTIISRRKKKRLNRCKDSVKKLFVYEHYSKYNGKKQDLYFYA